ncbi:DUF2970 domain-containing protein [Halomonas qinghailakensis]|uniref:DUF2970 domain-containing protein n=1 Tax=Halomonas qinghailakensis TaxID=2937790 RepID=A0AA46YQD9_9GAMM|nr:MULTISPECIES: DUF2970 domain-containing protein [Halomonas]UYO74543.1 DUF2970 domain-containing protein [Halomonas sp. ZZQ-149]
MWSVVKSVLSALLGVQNDHQRQQDFSSGKPTVFILTGIAITFLFVLILVGVAMIASR